MCTALEEEKLYFFHKKGKLLGRKGNPSIYRDSQISKPYLFSIFIIPYEASWPGWTNGWMANRIHTVMFAITKEGGKPLTKDTLTVLPSRWLNEFQRGDTHTHTHTCTDKTGVGKATSLNFTWDGMLEHILSYSCSAVYHAGIKVLIFNVEGPVCTARLQPNHGEKTGKRTAKIFAEMCMFDKVKRGVFELYSLSASWTPGISVNIRGCIDSFSSARVDILGLWWLIRDQMSSVEFVQ